MIRSPIEPRDWIFLKGYKFLSFTGNIGKNSSKNLNSKDSLKLLKTTSKRVIKKQQK